MRIRLLLCIALSVLCCFGQFEQGYIAGLVTDPQKAAIAGATVQIRSVSTNVMRELTTSSDGEYNSLPLAPGRYTVTVRQQGFRDRAVEVNVGVSQRSQVDITLELRGRTEQ